MGRRKDWLAKVLGLAVLGACGFVLAAVVIGAPLLADTLPPTSPVPTQPLTPVPQTPPTIDLAAASDTGDADNDNYTKDNTPTLEGTAGAGAVSVVIAEGAAIVGTAPVSSGTWSFTFPDQLADGQHSFVARAINAANQASPDSAPLNIEIDTSPPQVGTPDLTTASDTGLSDTDNETADTTPSFTGTGEGGRTTTLLTGSTARGTGATPGGSWAITSSTLPLATYSFSASQTDKAGNVGTSGTLSVKIVEATACHTATNVINGNASGNLINGTAAADRIFGLGGGDEINARGGGDCVVGGDGGDRINGEQGDDELRGDAGDDRANGGPGRDVVDLGAGNDRAELAGDGAVDRVDCGPGIEDRAELDGADTQVNCERVDRR